MKVTSLYRYVLLLLSVYSLPFSAQMMEWSMPLTRQYDAITPYCTKELFMVESQGKKGVIRADGTVIVPAEYDDISLFHEGRALVTRKDSKGERVAGCLTSAGAFHLFDKPYYTLSGQKFYSDGLLSVHNADRLPGYIDEAGIAVVGFDGKYDIIKPFVEGYAAVFKKKKYYLIDKNGTPVRFVFDHVAELFGGTNVYKGKAYVWDTDGKFYTYNVHRGGYCKKTSRPGNSKLDYLYRFTHVTGLTRDVPYEIAPELADSEVWDSVRLAIYSDKGLQGYKNYDESILLPAQFSQAKRLNDPYAIVQKNGAWGILRFSYDDPFKVNHEDWAEVKFTSSQATTTCTFLLTMPTAWSNRTLDIEVEETRSGQVYPISMNGKLCSFKVPTQGGGLRSYIIRVKGENLLLHEAAVSYAFTAICPSCRHAIGECPYRGKHPAALPKQQPKQKVKGKQVKRCVDCGLPEDLCPYRGVH